MRLISLAAVLAVAACASPSREADTSAHVAPPAASGTHEHDAQAHTPAHEPAPAAAHGEHAHGHSHDAVGAGCTCASAKLHNAWCGEHALGYVCGLPIASRSLFDGLDAHGHTLDRNVMQCAACKRMMDTGGFCEDCRFGWFGGQAYMSRITYHMAFGEVRDVDALACAACRDQAGDVGWCGRCAGGWAGNVFFVDRDEYQAAAREFGRLQAAIEASLRCETCALVILVDGTCPYCKLSYKGGERVGG